MTDFLTLNFIAISARITHFTYRENRVGKGGLNEKSQWAVKKVAKQFFSDNSDIVVSTFIHSEAIV